ncbi:LON peptidase substrate-binding domain-containing protein [Mycolicibacterium monacense]|uniref:ATP-dependent protease n=1 Tax=Mycolicibacterium monacense TaxID=85693 RepID=A0AAD1IZF8_MYCMB|nr:LON peptidase substrate-binding domain-containing protein [Mycolicibacterium monacense]MDA4100124.1 ATP-dependent protease [Mycolicibacterium monacense DSM 44395]OBB66728.1 ATP-dependent protease [Mycolicibacterium monacense]ORB14175.1 ATP-dependent protease [Mycolicibacterium monacense DSM 44395]BBZ62820.1 ATP-dependent protease [Mycolicibacterium monacense]
MTVTPMFPLEVTMLPGEELPLRIFEPRYVALVQDCLAMTDPAFGVVLIEAGREVGGGDRRSTVGALARIVDYADLGVGRFRLRCLMGERIRVRQWLDDAPYPRADIEVWEDEPGSVDSAAVFDVEDRVVALYERIAAARGSEFGGRSAVLGPEESDVVKRLYGLAARVPMGQADKYAVLSAPTVSARLSALSEAVDTVTAMVEFQLSE